MVGTGNIGYPGPKGPLGTPPASGSVVHKPRDIVDRLDQPRAARQVILALVEAIAPLNVRGTPIIELDTELRRAVEAARAYLVDRP